MAAAFRLFCLVLGALTAGAHAQTTTQPHIPGAALDALRKLKTIEDFSAPAMPRVDFQALLQVVLHDSTPEELRMLADEGHPVLRAVGLHGLALKDPKSAVPILQGRVRSPAVYALFSPGCVGYKVTEGRLAWALLHNENALSGQMGKPLLDESRLVRLDLEVLADEQCWSFHCEVLDAVAGPLENVAARSGSLGELRGWVGVESDRDLVKALGRVPASPAVRRILMKAAIDEKLDPSSRLAVASGLTRDGDPSTADFLKSNARAWDGLASDVRGADFARRQAARTRHERLYRLRASRGAFEKAFECDEPFALDDLAHALSSPQVEQDAALRMRMIQTLLRMSDRLVEVAHSWDTDSENLYRMMRLLEPPEPNVLVDTSLRSLLTRDEVERISGKADAALARLRQDSKPVR